ncbi:MAG: hypothetical protein KIT31_41010 [Deltaproteobacteria bacterium]|nr:hypothetical protein [Deltaproteobacteria bacterium]
MITYRHLEPEDPGSAPPRTAFAVPTVGARLTWYGYQDPKPGWRPYVVKCVEPFPDIPVEPDAEDEDATLSFEFLQTDGTFKGAEPGVPHTIVLTQQELVWWNVPSTLDGLSLSTPCAFLFLTDNLQALRPDLYEAGDAGGGALRREGGNGNGGTGKWPQGAAGRSLFDLVGVALRKVPWNDLEEDLTKEQVGLLQDVFVRTGRV